MTHHQSRHAERLRGVVRSRPVALIGVVRSRPVLLIGVVRSRRPVLLPVVLIGSRPVNPLG
jgi:hypothetical protein